MLIKKVKFMSSKIRRYWWTFPDLLNRVPISILMSISTVLLLIDMIMDVSFISFLLFVLGITGVVTAIYPRQISQFFSSCRRWQRRHKLNITSLICLLVITFWWLDITSTPAHAQFFIQTENWLRGAFPINGGTGGAGAGGTDIYSIVFNTLRAIFVLYLAVSLVRVIASARNDEDWQTLARTPLIILVTVTLGDILAGLITGGAGTAP